MKAFSSDKFERNSDGVLIMIVFFDSDGLCFLILMDCVF
jgi:hypothetical protein